MSEATTTVTEPEDDATVVYDEAAEEKAHEELVADVTKMLEQSGQEPEESAETEAKAESGDDEPPEKDDEPEKPAELSDELQVRAEGVGISKELAQHLLQTGRLEETLAAFDRTLIERFQSKETDDKPPQRQQRTQLPQPEDQEDVPELDPEEYGEDILKRDAYHQRRIDALETKLAQLLDDQQSAFDRRFDATVDGLGHEDLFGKGASVPKDKQANRDTLFRAYKAVCQAFDANPNDCDPQWVTRALAAMFPEAVLKPEEDVRKQEQRKTVDRLRDAEGKFLSSSKPRGAPPARELTEEEAHEELVSNVTAYLKKQGVQMSGV